MGQSASKSDHRPAISASEQGAHGLAYQIEAVVQRYNFGKPTAAKRGRHPEWPYVPIVDHGTHTEQLRGFAYVTRDEALRAAQRTIDFRRDELRHKLLTPHHRALREQHGLPRELSVEDRR